MQPFFEELQSRNEPLFLFGACNLLVAILCLVATRFSTTLVTGVNAWFKPFKFALSIGTFAWTMGWYTAYLRAEGAVRVYNWVVILLLGFEIMYIALQAARGQLSHYNARSPLYSFLYLLMGLAAAIVTLWTGYIGLLFFSDELKELPDYYVVSIRIGIFVFVFFSFQGASMGGRNTHTVGGPDGEEGVPVVNWSIKYGDLRIAHFIGMHALQVLPLLSWYVFKNTLATAIAGVAYTLLAGFVLVRALQGKPFPFRRTTVSR